ncbi:piggyBac transposable element-derived protein 4 [Nephila pilipes]|uniref:PiggyBac transposable element-derived protein 4 n=1 Tax=Nephila pilipes TaxID=299642 RepID=A0A8X6U0F5_NEPPI|nr:piggyBac transposable element-derived protein 4 [Nephila pilipes]
MKISNFLEELDDEDIDLDDEVDDPDFQDPAHNLQYSSDSGECEMDIDHDTIPQNTKKSDALIDTDTSLSLVDEIPSTNASCCRPILKCHADSNFLLRMTIPAESSPSLLFNLNRSATELDVFLKIFPKGLMISISQCTNQRFEKLEQIIHPTDPSEIACPRMHVTIRCRNSLIIGHLILVWET